MKVYYSGNYWGGHKYEHAGQEISINKLFVWGGLQWLIPALYICAKGLVIDLCVEIPIEGIRNYYKRWNRDWSRCGINEEDHIRMNRENPFSIDPQVVVKANGKVLEHSRMCSLGWHPLEEEQDQEGKVQAQLLEYYSCDKSQGWKFIRVCSPWTTSKKPELNTISLTLEQTPALYPGAHFVTTEFSEQQEHIIVHPITGMEYKLILSDCTTQTLPENSFQYKEDMIFPNIFKVLNYRTEPELTTKEFMIQDRVRSDPPRDRYNSTKPRMERSACSTGIIGRASGISAIFIPGEGAKEYHWRTACSSMHFEVVQNVEWQTMFYVKETEDIVVEIEL